LKNLDIVSKIKKNLNLKEKSDSFKLDLMLKKVNLKSIQEDLEKDYKVKTDKTMV